MTLRKHLDDVLAAIGADQPVLARTLAARLGEHVRVELPDESFTVGVRGGSVVTSGANEPAAITASTTQAVLRDVLVGRLSLHDALLADAIVLVGGIDTLLDMQEALGLFVNAAVRSPSVVPIYRRFVREPRGTEEGAEWR